MEISPNSETKPRVRRRLIQSTLFPHKSPDNVVCVDEDIEPDVEQEDDEDDNCGSQAKKGRKRKPKAAAQPRASRKLAVNGNEIGGKNTDEEGSPATVKVDFFVKVSERKKRQQKEQLPVLSPEKVEQVCSPPDVIMNSKSPRKPRRRTNTTPKKQQACVTPQKRQMNSNSKNATNGSLNEDCSDKMLASPPKQIPDLRLEAKMTAEENSRIFAGKQIHPFFSFRKAGKKTPETTSTENKWCDRKESNNDFSPVHVFDKSKVNTSDWRNGALVKQKFGEAVESHWLQCSMASSENPDNKSQLKSTPTKTKSTNDVIELIPLSDDEDSKDVCGPAAKPTNSQNGTKTLILFEDVDVTAYEDRGFIATIQQLAETAKRPMILTSNSDDPDLPNNLDRIEVSFKIPSSNELLRLAYTVCAAEKAEIDPCLAERFIDHCHGDIRKTIALLQFWCQGQNQRKDSEVRNTYAPLLFETNAGHHVLPQMIPFGYTSKLSETIDNEITKSTLLTKKDAMLMETIEEEEDENNNTQDINSKKDEMLRVHCFEQEENGLEFTRRTLQKKYDPVTSYDSEPCWNEDVLNITDELNEETPLETRNSRRKYNAVLSSDSEEECFNEDTCHPSEVPDVSCVPESSYVPETEIENGTMMYSTMCSSGCDYGIEKGPTNTDSETNNRNHGCEEDKVVRDLDLDNHEQVHGEEIGDSHIEPTESIPRDYQMMDECGRIEFSEKSESVHGFKSAGSIDAVQETWRKLRNCSKELSQYVSVEEKDTLEALRISYGMTNLISEADVLLADCQSLTCDNLKPSMISYDKSHSYSWHDDQLQMASAFAQHGFCVFAKRSFASGSNDKMDLAWEMLAASTNVVSLGKFINRKNSLIKSLGNKKLQSGACSKSILESPICNTIRSIAPSRSQLSLKGYVFHEYLSSLAHISRSESSRLSEAVNNSNQRRKRVARNYLSNGALSLSSEDISLLDQYKCYQKRSSETKSER